MRDYTSIQYLILLLILVDQILNAPAKHSEKKKKHSGSRKLTTVDINIQDTTEIYSNTEKSEREEYKHKNKHHKPASNPSQHKHNQRHHFSKLKVDTKDSQESHKTALRSPNTHKHHKSHKTKSKHRNKHKVKHVDTDIESNEDTAYKRVTKLDIEKPISEKKHRKNKKNDSSGTRDSDNRSKNERVDSKLDSDETWRPDINIEEESKSDSKASSESVQKNTHKKPSQSHNERKHHNIVKKNKIHKTSTTKPQNRLKIMLPESDTEVRSRGNLKETDTGPLVNEIVSVFKNNTEELKNKRIDINATLNNLASSKLLDVLTDRVANHMLKRLKKKINERSLKTHDFGATEPQVAPQVIEQIEIVFRNDDMVHSSELKADNINSKFYE